MTTPPAEAAIALHDAATLWNCRVSPAGDVVDAACAALVAGLDSPTLAILAALTAREADSEVPELVPTVLAELGLPELPQDGDAALEAAAVVLATQALAGRISPRLLAALAHRHFGHKMSLTEPLAVLDDEYDMAEYAGRTVDEIEADVLIEAQRLAARRVPLWPPPSETADPA